MERRGTCRPSLVDLCAELETAAVHEHDRVVPPGPKVSLRVKIVDTTNFTDKTRFRGSSDRLHVVERLWRVDDTTLMDRSAVENPRSWVRS